MSKLLKNSVIYSLGDILPKVANFIFLPIYTQYLTADEYGIIASLSALQSVLVIIFSLTLNRATYRLYYDYKTEVEKREYFGTLVVSIFFVSSILLSATFTFANEVQQIYKSISFYPYFTITILTAYLNIYEEVPKDYLQVTEQASKYLGFSITQFFAKNILIFVFVVYYELKAEGFLLSQLLAVLLTFPYILSLYRKIISFKLNKKVLIEILNFSLPALPVVLSAWAINLFDRIILEKYYPLSQIGIYSLGYQIAGVMLIITNGFKKAYDPYFYKIANNVEYSDAIVKFSQINKLYLSAAFTLSFSIVLISKEIILLFFSPDYYYSYQIVPIIALGYCINLVSGLQNLSFYQKKNTKMVMYITIIGGVVNIVVNIILIPYWGVYGAAWTTVLSYLLPMVIKYKYAKRNYFIPLPVYYLSLIISLFISLYLTFEYYIDFGVYLTFITKIGAIIIIYLVIIMSNWRLIGNKFIFNTFVKNV